jgi:hypothetical protein
MWLFSIFFCLLFLISDTIVIIIILTKYMLLNHEKYKYSIYRLSIDSIHSIYYNFYYLNINNNFTKTIKI